MRSALLALCLLVLPALSQAFPIRVDLDIRTTGSQGPVADPIQGYGYFILDTVVLETDDNGVVGGPGPGVLTAFVCDFGDHHLTLSDIGQYGLFWNPDTGANKWPYVGGHPQDFSFYGWQIQGDGFSLNGNDFPGITAGSFGEELVDVRWSTAYATLPEPSSWAVFLVGLAMVAWLPGRRVRPAR